MATVLEGFLSIARGKPEDSGFTIPLAKDASRDAARSILRRYADPPPGGSLVPRAWVEEHMAELIRAAEL